jgi:outer membrane protein OmpA-like peptidoglycan-associated protein
MKFSKLVLTIWAVSLMIFSSDALARTVSPLIDKRGNPVQDHRGNCARTKWLADQCCDVCGYPLPPAPEPIVVEKEKKIPYVDLVRQSIYFNIDKDNVDEVDNQRIDDVINEIRQSVAIRDVKLVGYADRFATNKYNIDLSKRRATHVLENFRNKGFFNDVTVGFGFFGEEKPVTNCPLNVSIPEQIACLQADRRVDIEVEVLRERVEITKETVAPAYPRPGTSNVEIYSRPAEVYSRPVDPNTMIQAPMAPAAPVVPAPVAPAPNIDVLGGNR